MTEQPEALRVADALEVDKWHVAGVTLQTAAELLREQHAEIKRLRAEREEDQGVIAVWRGRTQRAEAEIERLREALRSIAGNGCCDRCQEAALVARSALKKGEDSVLAHLGRADLTADQCAAAIRARGK